MQHVAQYMVGFSGIEQLSNLIGAFDLGSWKQARVVHATRLFLFKLCLAHETILSTYIRCTLHVHAYDFLYLQCLYC